MGLLSEYRRRESIIYRNMSSKLSGVLGLTLSIVLRIYSIGTERVTVLFMRDDEHEPIRLNIRIVTISLVLAAPVVMIGWGAFAAANLSGENTKLSAISTELQKVRRDLDERQEAISSLAQVSLQFESKLESVQRLLSKSGTASIGSAIADRLVSIRTFKSLQNADLALADLGRIRGLLEEPLEPLKGYAETIANRQAVLSGIPSLWPIQGDIGYITTYFGPSTNPFTGQPYLHTGLDISNARIGDPIIATADGTVAVAGFHPSYGIQVVIRHKSGYYSRYAHMQVLKVKSGQRVKQGTIIGNVGNTGLSTGPHVHYEVLLGGKITDPRNYLDLRNPEKKLN